MLSKTKYIYAHIHHQPTHPRRAIYFGLLNNLLLALIAVTVAVSLQTVGVALMVAMLVTPAATGYLLTRRLPEMMILAAALPPFRE